VISTRATNCPRERETVYLHLAARTLDWTSLPDEPHPRDRALSRRRRTAGRDVLPRNQPPSRPYFEGGLDGNPKSEIRNPKEGRKPKTEGVEEDPPTRNPKPEGIPKTKTRTRQVRSLEHRPFGFRTSDFGLPSAFGFRASDLAAVPPSGRPRTQGKAQRPETPAPHQTSLQKWWGVTFA